ncbi:glycosyltransferase family 2 protein [Dyadobacter jiangsuensis]|uniref:Glycosyltransferase involved in cell wall biosynthesis n=1 Tax=Dyadobacter jiangsuensis TaxID=1591085 RepID=A0A2P8G8L1_9BACT|nr:glycosyltransferase family 2 protein [Dyadobacter jiangsuensis]PSL30329.1 glycosyltransferase involved in cell wall biosynthesis [Dyadobacter jiangsuensis]
MTDTPKISIALCTYNGEQFLKTQLDSILGQTIDNWELVIVDDVSRDGTWDILQAYAAGDERFRLFRNDKNLGYNKNFQKALSLCEGEYIAICDQDDRWHPDKLRLQLEAIGNSFLIYHDSEFIDETGNSMGLKISDKFNFYRGSSPEAFLYLNCVSGHTILMKKELVAKAQPFPEGFYYDQWLAVNAASAGSIDFVGQVLVQYRQHSRNSTDILARNKMERSLDVKLSEIKRESLWIAQCVAKANGGTRDLLSRLAVLSESRIHSFASPQYGFLIWQHRTTLLSLLKKSGISKFFYVVRKIWGSKAKKLL